MNGKISFSYLSFFVLCIFLSYARSGVTKDAFISLRNRPAVSRSTFPLFRRQLSNSGPPSKNEDNVSPRPADTQPNNGGTSGNGDANKKPNETVQKPATGNPKPVVPSETPKPLDPVLPPIPITPISPISPVTPKPASAPAKRPTALVPSGDAVATDAAPTPPKEDTDAAKPAAKPETNPPPEPAAVPAATSPDGAKVAGRENAKSVAPPEKQSSSTMVILLSIGAASIVIVSGIVWGVRKYKLNSSVQFQSRLDPHQNIFAPNHHGFHSQPPSVLPSPAIVRPIAPSTFTLPRNHRPGTLENSSSAPSSPPRPPLSA